MSLKTITITLIAIIVIIQFLEVSPVQSIAGSRWSVIYMNGVFVVIILTVFNIRST